VPIIHGRNLDAALKARGVSSQLIVVPGRNHAFPGLPAEDREKLTQQVIQFLDQHSRP
jgi:dipeptidyl aminopeptidase/acylaminoacyl peptidase